MEYLEGTASAGLSATSPEPPLLCTALLPLVGLCMSDHRGSQLRSDYYRHWICFQSELFNR